MISLIDLMTLTLALCAATAWLPGHGREVFANNWAKFFLGKGVCTNLEFVTPVFVICVNAYYGKDRKKICTSEIVSLYPSICCIRVHCKRVALYYPIVKLFVGSTSCMLPINM